MMVKEENGGRKRKIRGWRRRRKDEEKKYKSKEEKEKIMKINVSSYTGVLISCSLSNYSESGFTFYWGYIFLVFCYIAELFWIRNLLKYRPIICNGGST
jgi:hypothetical protein